MDPLNPRPANRPRKSTRNNDRSSRGSHHDSNGRDTKAPRRRRSSTRDKERLDTNIRAPSKSSSTIGSRSGDGVKEKDSVSARAEELPADPKASESGGRRTAGGGGSSGTRPETAQEEEEDDEGESKTLNGAVGDDVNGAASDDSFSDNIVSSSRRYDGEGRGLVRGGSSDGGQGKDEGGGSGGVSGHCWEEYCKNGKASARCNSLMLSYERGNTTDLVQCVIVRDVSALDTTEAEGLTSRMFSRSVLRRGFQPCRSLFKG